MVALIVVGVGAWNWTHPVGPAPVDTAALRVNKERRERRAIHAACVDALLAQLKAPAQAEYTDAFDMKLVDDGDSVITSGVVDAPNAFGAKLRSQWFCVAKGSGDRWRVSRLHIDERR